MPVQPPPLEIRCPQCGWQQVWHPASDALTATDLPPACCPRCNYADLQARPSSTVSSAMGAAMGRLRQWLTQA